MINIVIPMAGEGSRFQQAGYQLPKPFIDVLGKPMIQRVMSNLLVPDSRFILLVRRSHLLAYPDLFKKLEDFFSSVIIIPIDLLTEGTACTVLFARQYINNSDPLIIANSDQFVDCTIQDMIIDATKRELDGSILTFQELSLDPKWSYAKIDQHNHVSEVREKLPISHQATVGIYYFKKGYYFVDAAIDMIIRNDRVNNEFYTCPTYNYLIESGKRVGIWEIPKSSMHGLGTPQDLQSFENGPGRLLLQ